MSDWHEHIMPVGGRVFTKSPTPPLWCALVRRCCSTLEGDPHRLDVCIAPPFPERDEPLREAAAQGLEALDCREAFRRGAHARLTVGA